jgi:hypothetical protein
MTDSEFNHRFDSVAELIRNVAERLEHRMDTMETAIEHRFDAQAARLERHAALWQTGSRWAARQEESNGNTE